MFFQGDIVFLVLCRSGNDSRYFAGRNISDIISTFEKRSRSSDKLEKPFTGKRRHGPATSAKSASSTPSVADQNDESRLKTASKSDVKTSADDTVQDRDGSDVDKPQKLSDSTENLPASPISAPATTNSVESLNSETPVDVPSLNDVTSAVSEKLNEDEDEADVSHASVDDQSVSTDPLHEIASNSADECAEAVEQVDVEIIEKESAEYQELSKDETDGDQVTATAESFLEKSSFTQQSPLTSSIFKALGIDEPSDADSEVSETKHQLDTSFDDLQTKKEFDPTPEYADEKASQPTSSLESDDERTGYEVHLVRLNSFDLPVFTVLIKKIKCENI